jgi:type I restriction enzyme S subunit
MIAEVNTTKSLFKAEIPGDWSLKKLADITKIYDGTHTTPNYVSSGVPFYSVEHVTSNNFEDTKFISEEVFAKESERVVLRKGDILMTRIGDIGTTKFIDWDVRASFYVSLALIKANNEDVNTQFISQFIISNYFQRELYQRTIHVAFPKKINLGEIGECLVILPPLPEQKAIAKVLSTADTAIHTTEKLIAQKELRKKWLMQQLLTGKKRLKGFSGEWKKCTAIDFLSQRNEQAPNNGNIPLFSLTIESGVTEKSDRYEREFLVKDKSIKSYKIVYPNDIVFNPANLRWGAIAKHTRSFKVLLSPIYEVLSVKKDFDIDFVSYLVSCPRQIAYYASILEGTLIERMAVKVEPFLATKYEIPDKKEQTAIAQVLQAADKEISLLKTKAEKLKEQKKGLMQVLLTGKKRLII